jgi:serine protease Do
VLAFGSPFGLSHSVTRGIVSAKGRYNLDLGDGDVKLQNFLQTDAAINPGNSGGPLVNLRGEVIGLNTAIASSSGGNEGIGFSIPINLAVRIAGQLVSSGEPSRGFLGVGLQDDFSAVAARARGLSRPVGALVTRVEQGSPAQLASIQVDDVILEFGETRVEDDDHLINLVQLTESGRKVGVELFRNGSRMRTEVEIGSLGAIEE